ncbi:hypothetical protein BN440_3523 [Erwinia amylovora MR1]|nr:hypothetical protein BN440_3523 [Erwinia amylovora MR1]
MRIHLVGTDNQRELKLWITLFTTVSRLGLTRYRKQILSVDNFQANG